MIRWLTLVSTLAWSFAGCTSEPDTADPVYASERVAPLRAELERGDDEFPYPENARAIVRTEAGGTVVVWIDQDDIRRVWAQASDPEDPRVWAEPQLLLRAGDGCLDLSIDSAGGTTAIGASCYASDVFIQQAPDQSMIAVTRDLVTWETGEFDREADPEPTVLDDGERVVWTNGSLGDYEVAEWTSDDGF